MSHSASRELFARFARSISQAAGHHVTFAAAVVLIVAWLLTGPLFGFSDAWQLVVNTGTTIITFLMVFLIQHTQNRDTGAMQLKLDELIRAVKGAEDTMINMEERTDDELNAAHERYQGLAEQARHHLDTRLSKRTQNRDPGPA